MKKVLWILLPLNLTVSSVAQDGARPSATNLQADTPSARLSWRVTARDTVSTTHEATEIATNAITGEVTNRAHRYVEVSSGLNYLDESGQWVESQDLVELTADGGAAAVHGPTKIHFNANLNTEGAITLTTSSNSVFRTHPPLSRLLRRQFRQVCGHLQTQRLRRGVAAAKSSRVQISICFTECGSALHYHQGFL
jgi:hypothetical protein